MTEKSLAREIIDTWPSIGQGRPHLLSIITRHLATQERERTEKIARLEAALRYFITYHLEGIGQLTHAIGGAEAALTDTPSDTVPVERARLREIEWESEDLCQRAACPACFNARMDGHAPGCWLAAAIANGD